MNNFYRVVYNRALGLKQVASEFACAGEKGKGRSASEGASGSSGQAKKILGSTASALALACGGGLAGQAEAAVVTYTADSTNTDVDFMYLSASTLGNSTLSDPSSLAIGSTEYKYAVILFRPDQDGTYVFGQTSAPVDTVMILYTGLFDSSTPGSGALVGNDDTSQATHRNAIGDATVVTLCGSSTSYCPQVTYNVVAGQVYSLLVSVYSGSSYNASFNIPFEFYSSGAGSFGSLSAMTPIDTNASFYLGSDIDFTVERIFKGGVLRLDQANHTFTQSFTVHNIATNTIDQFGNDTVFSGVISDAVQGEAGPLTIANSQSGGSVTFSGDNTYSGGTTISERGVLVISSDSNLGATTGGLTLDGGTLKTTVDMTSDRAVVLETRGGLLDSDAALTLNGLVEGTGALYKSGTGTLTLTGDNTYLGGTTISAGVLAGSAASFGSGVITNNAALVLDQASDATMGNVIEGAGTVLKLGSGSLTLAGVNTYLGGTTIDAGVLVGTASSFGSGVISNNAALVLDQASDATLGNVIEGAGSVTKLGSGSLTLGGGNTYTGSTLVAEGTLRAGIVGAFSNKSDHTVEAGSVLDLGGFDQTIASLDNAGTVAFSGSASSATLTVAGDYVGNGGTLLLNSQLGDDRSVTDKLVVEGSTSGQTFVQVANVAGAGAATDDGIQVIDVAGASDGQFVLQGRAVAGAYDYFLYQGGKSTPDDGDWYLRSELNSLVPQESESPIPVLRPELASYLGNQNAATQMFQHSLHDRAGEPGFTTRDDDNRGYATWVRVQNNQLDASVVGGQIGLDSHASIVQVGGEMQLWTGDSRVHLGLMGGYGRATTNGTSLLSGYRSKGEVKGTNLGVYGTWYQQGESATGLYVDGWAQYARFDNTVQGLGLVEESYDSHIWSGSIEAGYALPLYEGGQSALYVEPQAQVIYTDYSSDDVTEVNGTLVQSRKAGGTTTRLGARLYSRPLGTQYNRVQPFLAVNWWSGGDESTIAMDGARLKHNLPKNVYEAKAGAQIELGGGWSGWGQLGYKDGSNGYRDVNGQIGVKLNW